MRRSDRRFHRSAIGPGLISGFITLATGLAALSWKTPIDQVQVAWVIVGTIGATLYAGYRLFIGAKTASKEIHEIDTVGSKVDNAREMLRRIDARGRDSTLVLLARIMTICTEQVIMVAYEPDRFNVLVQTALECLHTAIVRGHSTDGHHLQVAVLTCSQSSGAGSLNAEQALLCYPGDKGLQVDSTEEAADHAAILMSRRHPYENGWLRYLGDGVPAGPEGHILPPQDNRVVSYIRVGIPQVGVLLVDSWDTPLSTAERRLTAAFADVLALPYKTKPGSVPAVPAQASGGREFEGAQ